MAADGDQPGTWACYHESNALRIKRFTDASKGCMIHKNATFCGLLGNNGRFQLYNGPIAPDRYQI
ncbi:hypothetical protein A3196_00440 [Candidatus Thiodiazotropha endoloripes]|uniref:Uncharacterized protein n=1 Tax=Candidatus Thiodiazotropha endoloripes TaxID=1818881 RepID=A0A1E2UKT5_9GAMM|nr:hypothetical protein A3196_00440 [Candidatus Thiodiazotropha endoloripes]